ncbi:MAG TPA: MauE/DoxX family redox-associated membrane protein [Puia sp.]|nr:MauE/DoxX family redox-associated membrane protein [Puia sp.]
MKTRKIVVEAICFVLLMNWFYEGIYKVAYWGSFSFYMRHAPLLKPVWQILAYGIPVGEIGLALMFLFSKLRIKALYISMGASLMLILWVTGAYLFAHRVFLPYNAPWSSPTWAQKMLFSIGLCWVSFAAAMLLNKKLSFKKFSTNSLRNKPANAQ